MDVPAPSDVVRAWRPHVPGIAEVLHADWHAHAYPAHTHDTWTLLLVDDGMIGYDLDSRRDRAALRDGVTLLPPDVTHDGHGLTDRGFRKRVVYLDRGAVPSSLIGRCVDTPTMHDPLLRARVAGLHDALDAGEDLEAESRTALIADRLTWHLSGRPATRLERATLAGDVAAQARELIDADPVGVGSVATLAATLGVSSAHLVRRFTRAYAIPPHRYVIGRRLDLARALLLDGVPAAQVATATGFFDQAHLTRHFTALLSTTPGRYQRSRPLVRAA